MLTELDYKNAAKILKCEVACIKAVKEVESSGNGFLSDGQVKILFEGHIFSRYTKHIYDGSHPTISYPKWTSKFYCRGKNADVRGLCELGRQAEAVKLNRTAGLMSASYGLFQIMGFNFAQCGYTNVEDFVLAMQESEGKQLELFCNYVKSVGLDDELRYKMWGAFAYKYNGTAYKKNQYDTKLGNAYIKYA